MKSLNSSDSLRHSNWVSTAKLFFFRAVMCSPQVNHPFSPFLWLKKAVFPLVNSSNPTNLNPFCKDMYFFPLYLELVKVKDY